MKQIADLLAKNHAAEASNLYDRQVTDVIVDSEKVKGVKFPVGLWDKIQCLLRQ